MYKYKYNRDATTKFSSPIDPKTPDVMLELAWGTKERMNSFLEVDFEFVNRSDKEIGYNHISRAPWEKELSKLPFKQLQKKTEKKGGPTAFTDASMGMDKVMRLRAWEKFS